MSKEIPHLLNVTVNGIESNPEVSDDYSTDSDEMKEDMVMEIDNGMYDVGKCSYIK